MEFTNLDLAEKAYKIVTVETLNGNVYCPAIYLTTNSPNFTEIISKDITFIKLNCNRNHLLEYIKCVSTKGEVVYTTHLYEVAHSFGNDVLKKEIITKLSTSQLIYIFQKHAKAITDYDDEIFKKDTMEEIVSNKNYALHLKFDKHAHLEGKIIIHGLIFDRHTGNVRPIEDNDPVELERIDPVTMMLSVFNNQIIGFVKDTMRDHLERTSIPVRKSQKVDYFKQWCDFKI